MEDSSSSSSWRRDRGVSDGPAGVQKQVRHQRRARIGSGCWGLLLALLVTMICGASGLNSEGLALLAFKRAVLDDPRQTLSDWNQGDATPCNWTGISCGAGSQSVEQISLPRKRLLGRIVDDLGNLTNLRRLNLHDNAFFGSLPADLFGSSAPLLKTLFLHNNNLSGPLPASIDRLVALQHLDISNNGFVGDIPPQIAACTRLLTLLLGGNDLSGPIPEGLGSALTSLRSLDFSSNRLSGTIPPDFGNLTVLQLNLSSNQLQGAIPASLGNLPDSASLDFSSNNLSGPIPRDGALANQSPSAFSNNPGLCGAPLATACAPSEAPSPGAASALGPSSPSPAAVTMRKAGLSTKALIAIVVGDSVGILVIVIVFVYCLRRRSNCQKPKKRYENGNGNNSSDNSASNSQSWGLGCFPVSKDGSEASEKIEQGELTRLDSDVKFDLEELLRASAYVLGKSGVGIVYKALLEEGVAVAVRRLGEGGANSFKEFEHEVQLVGKIRHPNIVSLRAYYWAVDEKLLIYDFIPNGSLAQALHARTPDSPVSTPLNWAERLKIAQGAARGLAYIHACGGKHKLVHRDIKSSNILLDVDMEARISDLGLARLQNLAGGSVIAPKPAEGESLSTSSAPSSIQGLSGGLGGSGGVGRRGPPASDQRISPSASYYPPEASEAKKKATQKWDVYSFGVVLLEILTGRSPAMHLASAEMDLATWVRETVEERKPISEVLDIHLCAEISKLESEFMEALQIALLCTEPSPEQRPTMGLASHSLEQIGRKLEICVSE
ncbi:hypothetical protein Mp_5g20310 [Marchantia polymorpha subsp. ruderalis]|uniref:non-specific serine/threonine protein kinase n=2 Tax=Marchantia polymorpha TaxID=3197 RepID=A0AAF6BKD0_MARPO|nr:hypothetical protein MARPO_0058s0008 [Marchantia polymorpha]BBN12464.1 hypothetical protein Mp_5g20310 [Marchantia polymorpha subsp. ruderalis]|eukprot:PTQ37216.1 hypothetical protein MARPO_0058s0008 [Marchantia polymorpha]